MAHALLMFFRTLPEKWHLHCKAMLFAVDPGTATPDTQLHASQLINTSALTAQKKSHQWPGYVYQRSWTGLFIPQWQRLLYSLGTDVNGVSLLFWMNPVPALTGTFNTDWQELQLPQRPLTRIRQVQKHNFYSLGDVTLQPLGSGQVVLEKWGKSFHFLISG